MIHTVSITVGSKLSGHTRNCVSPVQRKAEKQRAHRATRRSARAALRSYLEGNEDADLFCAFKPDAWNLT